MRDVVLKSGREVKLKPLNALQRAEIMDIAKVYALKYPEVRESADGGMSIKAFTQAAMFATGLNIDDWNLDEIIEVGANALEDAWLKDTDKKK